MRKGSRGVIAILLVLMLAGPSALAASAVELGEGISLSDEDLGLNGVATDGDGETALVYGADAYVRALDVNDPTQQIDLTWPGSQELLDGDFHPGGQTAFVVGEGGLVLRYAKQDHSLERAASESALNFSDISSVAWNTGGSWAYIGSAEGQIWRLRAAEDGGAEIHSLAGGGSSPIMAMDCHPTIMMCVVAAAIEGIGIIERDHTFTWVGGTGYPWTGIECPTGETPYCVAVADNQMVAMIELNPNDLSASIPSISQLPDVNAYFVGIEAQQGDRTLIAMSPSSLIEHDISLNASFPWLDHSDINDLNLSGDRIVGTWSTAQNAGWIVTARGHLIPFAGEVDDSSAGLLSVWILIAIPAATGLVVLSLVFSVSPEAQRWYTQRFGNKEDKRRLADDSRRKTRAERRKK